MMRSKSSRAELLAISGGCFLLVSVVYMVLTPKATGFETSIYAAYPLWIWAFLIAAFGIGQLLILRDAFTDSPGSTNWIRGFLLTLAVLVILLLMPVIRGYPIYGRADLLTHIGHTTVIHETGGAPFQNIYQNIHQLVLSLSYATGVAPRYLFNFVPLITTLFSVLASYLLLTTVFERRRMLMTLPFVVVLVAGSTHMNPSPYAQSVLFLPFVLYLFARTQMTELITFRLLLAAVIIALVLFHPLTALFLLAVFGVHYLVVSYRSWQGTIDLAAPVSKVSAASIFQLALVTFVAWYYNFVGVFLRFEEVFRRLLDPGESETELDTYGATITEFSPSYVDIARIGVFRFGERFLLLGIGVLFVAIAAVTYARGNRFSSSYLSTFTHGFIVFCGFGALFLAVDLIGGFGRPLVFAQYFAAFLAGSLVLELYTRTSKRKLLLAITVAVAVLLATVTVATLYTSPMAGGSTSQVTEQDIAGAEWYLDNELNESPLQEYGTTMYRFEHLLAGTESNTIPREGTFPPDGFNYTEHDTLGTSYETDQYLVVTERGKQFYPNAYPGYDDSWRFHPTDFELLQGDPTVTQVYNTGEIEIYRVEATDAGS